MSILHNHSNYLEILFSIRYNSKFSSSIYLFNTFYILFLINYQILLFLILKIDIFALLLIFTIIIYNEVNLNMKLQNLIHHFLI
jgi:hypothetical protein